MAGVGIVLAWFGYAVLYYGLDTVTGGNDSFVSLIWPGRYAPTARDGASGSSSSGSKSGGLLGPPGAPGSIVPSTAGAQLAGKKICIPFTNICVNNPIGGIGG